jgi:serine/tyrosine/threonine adenylyltransferase
LNFDNRFLAEVPGDSEAKAGSRQTPNVCWSAVQLSPVAQPTLLLYAPEVADLLGLSTEDMQSEAWLAALSGNRLLPGMHSYATRYGGHQFGQWAGQLGDGRAMSLGESVNARGERWELQLKGAGATPYSRRADGRAVLRSSLREFLCSEAMHHLGVPTTRALSLVGTGEGVLRDMFYDGRAAVEPGAIVCRVAPSFIRFGHFEILAATGELALLQRLVDFTMARDFPHLIGTPDERFAVWFSEVCQRTAHLMVEWLRVGFVHGVMNTDNMSILGLTIDYGPYGWMDDFDPDWTPNTTDATGRRYSYLHQPEMARWNLDRLADALSRIAPSPALLQAGLAQFDVTYQQAMCTMLAGKFGVSDWQDSDWAWVQSAFDLMQRSEVDMTEFFRALADVDISAPQLSTLHPAFYQESLYQTHQAEWTHWLEDYATRLAGQDNRPRRAQMNHINPRFIPRNYLAQHAIEAAHQNNLAPLQALLDAARRPYDNNLPAEFIGKRADWARHKAGCSMLSCSS